jgi:hypothetical protein
MAKGGETHAGQCFSATTAMPIVAFSHGRSLARPYYSRALSISLRLSFGKEMQPSSLSFLSTSLGLMQQLP